jgi:hypothetical protein
MSSDSICRTIKVPFLLHQDILINRLTLYSNDSYNWW